MNKTRLRSHRRTVCPSCKEAIHFRLEHDDLGVCPRCGEWLIGRNRSNRYLERLDSRGDGGFEESLRDGRSYAGRFN